MIDYILISSRVSKFKRVIEWAERQAAIVVGGNSIADCLSKVKTTSESAPKNVLWVDYPVVEDRDSQTLDSFCADALLRNHSTYYAPRPNDYVWVENAALAYFSFTPKREQGKPSISDRVMYRINRYLFNKEDEGKSVSALGGAARTVTQAADQSEGPFSDSLKLNGEDAMPPTLQPVIPASLRLYGSEWNLWRPTADALSFDLTKRNNFYFSRPKSFHVVLLNKCNLECVMCPYHSPKYKPHHTTSFFDDYNAMSDDVFDKIVDYAAREDVTLDFGQVEEPLMHKKILDFIEKASSAGVPSINLTTNGTLLTKEKSRRLAKSGISSVMFSIDASNAETYRKIRGADLEELEENIKYFVSLAKPSGITTWVSFILQPEGVQERHSFFEKWKAIGIDQITFYVLTERDPITGSRIDNNTLYQPGERYACSSPWIQSVILPTGDVSLCCKAQGDLGWREIVSMGNLNQKSFDEIWYGEEYTELREMHMKSTFSDDHICADCRIWSASNSSTVEHEKYTIYNNETMITYQFKNNAASTGTS